MFEQAKWWTWTLMGSLLTALVQERVSDMDPFHCEQRTSISELQN